MNNNDVRVSLKNLSAHQLPEFIRSEYPTFVSFVEAYYEFLDNQNVSISNLRDIDTTLDEYIKYFKAELAHNYPVVSDNYDTERFLLKHIKEQYLAKGSEASYKLLFRLLYGKDVYLDYPGRQMLRISDGRWTQDVSIYVEVLQGNPYNLIGKSVTVQTAKKIFNMDVVKNVDAASTINATVENVLPVDVDRGIYELFVNRNFYGDITPKDSIKYGSEFQAQIIPATTRIKIKEPGKNFKPGQVFQLSSGEGKPFWFKVSTITEEGGLKTIDVIKFGLDYKTDFSVTVLPSSAVSTRKKISNGVSGSLSYNVIQNGLAVVNIIDAGQDYTLPPIIDVQGNGTGATAVAVLGTGANAGKVVSVEITNFGSNYDDINLVISNAPGDTTGFGFEAVAVIGDDYSYNLSERINGFTEGGYINAGDYWDVSESGRGAVITPVMGSGATEGKVVGLTIVNGGSGYTLSKPTIDISIPIDVDGIPIIGSVGAKATLTVTNGVITGATVTEQGSGYLEAPTIRVYGAYGYANGAYVGTIQRQFFINAADTQGKDPALLDVSLGAVIKYPGYYRTNDGFISDSMFIQDSYYYQAFAYVLKIDEQLQSYASVVRSMLHPSGMAMFGEYSINNKISLSVGLDALVKSLGVTLYDYFGFTEQVHYDFIKDLSDSRNATDSIPTFWVYRALQDSFGVSHTEAEFSKVYGKQMGLQGTTYTYSPTLTVFYTSETEHKVQPVDLTTLNVNKVTDISFTDVNKKDGNNNLVGEFTNKLTTKNIPLVEGQVTISEYSGGTQYPVLDVSLNMEEDYLVAATFGNSGYITVDPYEQGGYFEEHYANSRPSVW